MTYEGLPKTLPDAYSLLKPITKEVGPDTTGPLSPPVNSREGEKRGVRKIIKDHNGAVNGFNEKLKELEEKGIIEVAIIAAVFYIGAHLLAWAQNRGTPKPPGTPPRRLGTPPRRLGTPNKGRNAKKEPRETGKRGKKPPK